MNTENNNSNNTNNPENKNPVSNTETTQTPPASAPEQQQAKEEIKDRVDLLDRTVETGEKIEQETKGENPNWQEVKEVFVGNPPINKVTEELSSQSPKVEEKKVEPTAQVQETPKETKAEPRASKTEKPAPKPSFKIHTHTV